MVGSFSLLTLEMIQASLLSSNFAKNQESTESKFFVDFDPYGLQTTLTLSVVGLEGLVCLNKTLHSFKFSGIRKCYKNSYHHIKQNLDNYE